MYHFPVVKVKQHPNLLHKICEENNRLCLTIFINLKGGIVEVVCNTAYIAFVSRTGTGDKKKDNWFNSRHFAKQENHDLKNEKKNRFEQVHGKPW